MMDKRLVKAASLENISKEIWIWINNLNNYVVAAIYVETREIIDVTRT